MGSVIAILEQVEERAPTRTRMGFTEGDARTHTGARFQSTFIIGKFGSLSQNRWGLQSVAVAESSISGGFGFIFRVSSRYKWRGGMSVCVPIQFHELFIGRTDQTNFFPGRFSLRLQQWQCEESRKTRQ